jgi:hypothetical protein
MSASGVSRISPLRCAGALVLCAVAGAGVQTLVQPSATRTLADAGSAAGAAPSPGNTAARAAMPTRESLAALSAEEQITSLAAALPHMEIADILPLVEHLLKARGVAPDEPPDLIRALFTRWAALDAAGLSAYVESGPLRYDYDARRLAVLSLVEVRGLSALEEVRATSPTLAREAAREMLIRQPEQLEVLLPFLKGGRHLGSVEYFPADRRESENQIARILSPVQVLIYSMEMGYPLDGALGQLGAMNPDDVLRSFKALPPGSRRDQALSSWLRYKVPSAGTALTNKENDYTFFLREYEAMAEGPARSALNSRYATLRALENPDAALKWAQSLPDARQRFEAVSTICGSLFMGTDAGNTFLGFYGREGDAAERLTRQLADAWMAAPEVAAASHLGSSTYELYPFVEWHIKDPAASEAWLATVPNPELRKLLVESVDLPAAARLQLLPDSVTRIQAVVAGASFSRPFVSHYEIAKELAARLHHLEQSPPIGAEWEALTAAERHALSAAFIRKVANPQPPAMTGHLNLSALAMPDAAGSGSNSFAAGPDGEKNDWLGLFNSLPPAERSLGAYYEAGAAYIKSDEAEASRWLDSLPPGAERDAAATALVEHLVKPGDSQDGEAAFAWAAAMSGETERVRYTAEAIRAWSAEDSAAARRGIFTAPLPNREKSALLGLLATEGGPR